MALVEFIEHWYKKGKSEDNDVFRFFCYYVAFNHLFEESYSENKCGECKRASHENCKTCYEKKKICNLISHYFPEINSRFNPFDGDILNRESELIVKTVWKNTIDGDESDAGNREVKYSERTSRNYKNLFCNIHQVRCNLFHGAKEMQFIRDKELVRESADVLEHFLECMIEILKH